MKRQVTFVLCVSVMATAMLAGYVNAGEGRVPVSVPRAKVFLADLPEVVAEVDGQKVTRRDFINFLLAEGVYPRLRGILDGLILEKLVIARAKEKAIGVTEKEVDDRLAKMREEIKLNSSGRTTLEKELEKANMTMEDFRRQSRLQLLLQKIFNFERGVLKDNLLSRVSLEKLNVLGKNILNLAKVSFGKSVEKPGIIAIANNIKITEAEIVTEMLRDIARDELVQHIKGYINDTLVSNTIKSSGIKLLEKDLDNMLKAVEMKIHRERPELSQVPLARILEIRDSSIEELKNSESFRRRVLFAKYIASEIKEEELREYYKKNEDVYGQRAVRISHILTLAVHPDTKKPIDKDSFERALMRIQNVERLLKKDAAKFEVLAAKYSEDEETRENGGNLGVITSRNNLDPNFSSVALKLKKGEVSKPVRSSFGWHIIKCTDVPDSFILVRPLVEMEMVTVKQKEWFDNKWKQSKATEFLSTAAPKK